VFLAGSLFLAGYLTWILWGTGITTAQAQTRLRNELDPLLGTRPVAAGPTHAPGHRPLRLGGGIALLEIPRISLSAVVVEGVDPGSLREGPGHYPDSAYPWEPHGRVAIAGHRTSYLHPFWSLDRLRPGDRIMLRTEYGTFRYAVTSAGVVPPGDDVVLAQTWDPTLVLTTCDPRFSSGRRLVVFARRLGR